MDGVVFSGSSEESSAACDCDDAAVSRVLCTRLQYLIRLAGATVTVHNLGEHTLQPWYNHSS